LAPDEEKQFRSWVSANKVPFDPAAKDSDYDMRGFWKALQAGDEKAVTAMNSNDGKPHYPDYWKTPFHRTFSRDSQWATPDAPTWNQQDQLVDANGNVMFDERVKPEGPRRLELKFNALPVSAVPKDEYGVWPEGIMHLTPQQASKSGGMAFR